MACIEDVALIVFGFPTERKGEGSDQYKTLKLKDMFPFIR